MTALAIFFVPYGLFEPITNVLIRQFPVKLFILSIILAWTSARHNSCRVWGPR